MYLGAQKPEEAVRFPRARVTDSLNYLVWMLGSSAIVTNDLNC